MADFVEGVSFESGTFEVTAVFVGISRKLIRRVYSSAQAEEIEPLGETGYAMYVPTEGPPEDTLSLLKGMSS
jgi:hypothetical protein